MRAKAPSLFLFNFPELPLKMITNPLSRSLTLYETRTILISVNHCIYVYISNSPRNEDKTLLY